MSVGVWLTQICPGSQLWWPVKLHSRAAHLPASGLVRAAGWLMLAGTVLFSGSLYVLAATGVRALGMVTPFGGLAFILAWLLLALALVRS